MVQREHRTPPVKVDTRVRAKRDIEGVPPSTCGTVRRIYETLHLYEVRFDGYPAIRDVFESEVDVMSDECATAHA